ncbi:tail fiber domain-containing protein [Flavobacterium ginsenosidimutans]|uniref:Tail fiber domain-containing protein n=1 Tax=Flavobacterium ginsenosidimutans TaxID=687844 RepID=A0ABZ2QBM9_9FLAO
MKKIVCLLFLIQSGLMMAQTETVVTVNGKKVQVVPNAGTADNGLTADNGKIQLGGDLTKPTTLTTTAVNTLKIAGLQTGTTTDYLLTTDVNGVVKQIANNAWSINGNRGTNYLKNGIGTLDDQNLVFLRKNEVSGMIGVSNTSFGLGSSGGMFRSDRGYNVAIGVNAAGANAENSVAVGYEALKSSLSKNNVAVGYQSLLNDKNTADNVAIGSESLKNHLTGDANTAVGSFALNNNQIGIRNTAIGASALKDLKNGNFNTVLNSALGSLQSGDFNIALGFGAGSGYGNANDNGNTPSGSLVTSNGSVFIGSSAGPLADNSNNEIVIGTNALGRGSNTVQIGNSNMTSIGGAVNWSIGSDVRLKKDIATSTYGLNFINKLRPVTYKMKTGTTALQSGFIAQEVETAANSIGYEFNGIVKPQSDSDFYSLRYSEFVVPLVKAVQEQQKLIEDQQTQINEQQKLLGAKEAKILEIENRLLKLEQKLK